MADEIIKQDANKVPVMAGVSNDENQYIIQLRVDPVTKRVLVDSVISGGEIRLKDILGNLINPAKEDGNLNDLLQLLKMLIQSPIGRLAIDSANRLRVVVDTTVAVSQSGTWTISQSGVWMMPSWTPGNIQQQLSNIEYNECQRSKFTFV
jgi:hypothetical protein